MDTSLLRELRRLELMLDFLEVWFFFFWLACGIWAAMLAESKNRSGKGWGVLALIFGPTVFFVLGFLPVLDCGDDEFFSLGNPLPRRRKCPHCAETIKAEAKVCKHCGRDVPEIPTQEQATARPQAQRPHEQAHAAPPEQEPPSPTARYCHSCGASAPLDATSCPVCLRDLPARAIFCPGCAHDISFKPDVCPGCGSALRWRKREEQTA